MQFKKLVLLVVLLFSGQLVACDIPKNCRVKNQNQNPGYCSWACLETMGRFHKIEKMYDLLENRKAEKDLEAIDWFGNTVVYKKHLGYDFAIHKKLDDLKVRYWMQDSGNGDRKLLKYSGSHGCLVAVQASALKDAKVPHAIVLIDYDESNVRFYDPNHPDLVWTATRKWFDMYWTGLAIVVENHVSKR